MSFSSISHSESKPRNKVSVGQYSPPCDSLLKEGNRLIVVFKSDSGNILIDIFMSKTSEVCDVCCIRLAAFCILIMRAILCPALRLGIVACGQYYRAPAWLEYGTEHTCNGSQ
jgi:hypothetical protein